MTTTDRLQRQIAFHLERADNLERHARRPFRASKYAWLHAATIHRMAARELKAILDDVVVDKWLDEARNRVPYRPLYAEKRCLVCGSWRGQHLGSSANDSEMICPTGQDVAAWLGVMPTFVPTGPIRGAISPTE